jgi:hypothetical protein
MLTMIPVYPVPVPRKDVCIVCMKGFQHPDLLFVQIPQHGGEMVLMKLTCGGCFHAGEDDVVIIPRFREADFALIAGGHER